MIVGTKGTELRVRDRIVVQMITTYEQPSGAQAEYFASKTITRGNIHLDIDFNKVILMGYTLSFGADEIYEDNTPPSSPQEVFCFDLWSPSSVLLSGMTTKVTSSIKEAKYTLFSVANRIRNCIELDSCIFVDFYAVFSESQNIKKRFLANRCQFIGFWGNAFNISGQDQVIIESSTFNSCFEVPITVCKNKHVANILFIYD